MIWLFVGPIEVYLLDFLNIFKFFSVLYLLCLCARLFICALWSPAGKGLASWLSFWCITVVFHFPHRYPWSVVVFDCIDS